MTANFVRTAQHFDNSTKTWILRLRCTRCNKQISAWVIGPSGQKEKATAKRVLIHPDVSPQAFEDLPERGIPPKIYKVYQDAIRSYEAGIWDGAATLCGKALEGITKEIIPKEERAKLKALGPLLRELPKHLDLKKPFERVTSAIHKGRNLGAHFDELTEADEDTAAGLLGLVEFILKYVYLVGNDADALKEKLESQPTRDSQPAGEQEDDAASDNPT